jgi:polysaccharide export outer membrane protein
MDSLRYVCVIAVLVLLTSCATVVTNAVPVDSETKAVSEVLTEYRIHPGDQLELKFFYNSELNEQVTVRPDGRISLQLANEIMAAGLTPAELTALLKTKYSSEIAKPEITVFVRSFIQQRVFVDGEVNKAGLIALTGPMTVLQSIAQAGGMKETACTDEIIVIRRDADNKLMTMVVNLEQALSNSDMMQDIKLMPNDIVFVPRSSIANVNLWVDQYVRRNLPVTPTFGYNFGN